MKSTQEFEVWRSGEIVKLLLLSSGFSRIVPDPENKVDFIAVSEKLPGRLLAVEVKAGANPQAQVQSWTQQLRNEHPLTQPVLVAVVDSKQEEGFFVLLGFGPDTHAQPLTKAALEETFHLLAA